MNEQAMNEQAMNDERLSFLQRIHMDSLRLHVVTSRRFTNSQLSFFEHPVAVPFLSGAGKWIGTSGG